MEKFLQDAIPRSLSTERFHFSVDWVRAAEKLTMVTVGGLGRVQVIRVEYFPKPTEWIEIEKAPDGSLYFL